MTIAIESAEPTVHRPPDQPAQQSQESPPSAVPFILYLDGPDYDDAVRRLSLWVQHLLLPVYGREITSMAPWCSRWWEHREAVAQLYGLWMAWVELTRPGGPLTGPANWQRDYLAPVMGSLRDPSGPFAGCKPGAHRAKETPHSEEIVG